MMKTIGQAYTGRDNRLTLIRLALATAVLTEHAIIVTQGPLLPPPLAVNGWSLSYVAVNAFFVLSGFLIADSLERRADVFTYAASRALRLMPALLLLSAAAVFGFGPYFTELAPAEYWASAQTWMFPVQVLGFLDTSQGPAGLFADLPWAGEFSASLWTLRYEMIAYVAAAIIFFSPLPWGKYTHLILFGITGATYMALALFWSEAPPVIISSARLSSAFTLGMVIHGWRHSLPVAPWIAGISLPVWLLAGDAPWAEPFLNITLATTLFWLAFARLAGLPTWSKLPDWSYGIYIWHYPIMQSVLYLNRDADPLFIAAMSLPASFIVAAFSWHVVEKPSLGSKSRFGDLLRSLFGRSKRVAKPGNL
jgi:peptidoglycan/LPS O-acetylase OafA/YrhL